MQLRNSISNTKKFFQKTLQSFKSFFSTSSEPYQKLPKASLYNPISFATTTPTGIGLNNPQASNFQDLDKFYSDFTDRWGSGSGQTKKRQKQKIMISTGHDHHPTGEEKQRRDQGNDQSKRREDYSYSKGKREAISLSVAQKLKEIEMMDMSNVDHVLDIEEILHYYSRLTCPAYLDIVDKFFMDMYTEFWALLLLLQVSIRDRNFDQ
ncbi:hypothetical protein PTKIN_Ptkin19aG0057600 [Pterospermum kingtungense]